MEGDTGFIVPPLSRREIRQIAQGVRSSLRISEPWFPIVEVLEFALPGEGLGISRAVLDGILFRRAAASGARTSEGSLVKGTRERVVRGTRAIELDIERRSPGEPASMLAVEARCLVTAYGREGRLGDEREGSVLSRANERYVGLKKHHRPAGSAEGSRLRDELRDAVEIHAVEGGYCGLSFVEGDTVNVCMLLRGTTLTALATSRWPDVRRFLEEGNKVKITVRFRGREITHPETAQRQIDAIAEAVSDIGVVEQSSRMEGRAMTAILSPKGRAVTRVRRSDVDHALAPEGGDDANA